MKTVLVSLALLAASIPGWAQVGQDLKHAGEDTKNAAVTGTKKSGRAIKNGATKSTHAVKKGATKSTHAVKKGVHKTATYVGDKTSGTSTHP